MDEQDGATTEWDDEIEAWISPVVFRLCHDFGLKADDRLASLQAARVRVWQAMRRWDEDGGASRKTWACRHAAYAVADFARRLSSPFNLVDDPGIEPVDSTAPSPFVALATKELLEGLRACIARLRQPQRRRVEMTLVATRPTLRQLATQDGVSFDSFRESIGRARVQLRQCLEGKGLTLLERLG